MPAKFVQSVQRATHRIGLYLSSLPRNEVTQGEAHILALLARSRRASIAQLHRGLAHKRSTLTSILDRLNERGLIERAVNESDRRTFVISLTRKGAKLADRLHRHISELERRVRRRVSASEVRGFTKVVATLTEEADRSARMGRRGRVGKKKREIIRPRI